MTRSLEITLESNGAHIVLQLRGKYDLSLLRHTIKEIGVRSRETGSRCILADAHADPGGIGLLDLHQIGELIAREIPRGCRVAVVVSKARLEMDRHLETVAVNRGVSLRLFTDIEEARHWLNSLGTGFNAQMSVSAFATDEQRTKIHG
jgi:hypothetical protein